MRRIMKKIYTSGPFDSIEEALLLGADELDLEKGDYIWIGERVDFQSSILLYAIFDQISCDACELAGEAGENYNPLEECTKEEEMELKNAMDEVLTNRLTKTKNNPTFFGIQKLEN